MSEYLVASRVSIEFQVSPRTLVRAGVPHYRLRPKGKRYFKKSEIEAALTRHVSAVRTEKDQLDAIVNLTVDEVLKNL